MNLRSFQSVGMILLLIIMSMVTMMGFLGWIYHFTGSARFVFSFINSSMPIVLLTIANSDGGTVYLISDNDQKLSFEIMHTLSLNIKFGGSSDPVPESIYPVKIYNDDGSKNINNVAAVCALENKTINIKDAYSDKNYDFEWEQNTNLKFHKDIAKKHMYSSLDQIIAYSSKFSVQIAIETEGSLSKKDYLFE